MLKVFIVILLLLWLCVMLCVGVNIYNQYQISKQNARIIHDYEFKSELDDVFTTAQDSLDKDIALAEQEKVRLNQSFPLKDSEQNWLFIKLAIIFLALATIVTYWIYYKKKAQE